MQNLSHDAMPKTRFLHFLLGVLERLRVCAGDGLRTLLGGRGVPTRVVVVVDFEEEEEILASPSACKMAGPNTKKT